MNEKVREVPVETIIEELDLVPVVTFEFSMGKDGKPGAMLRIQSLDKDAPPAELFTAPHLGYLFETAGRFLLRLARAHQAARMQADIRAQVVDLTELFAGLVGGNSRPPYRES